MAHDDSSAGTIIIAFVLGTLTGAAVALLMAPQSGEETRRKIGDKAREGADKAREVADKARDVAGQGRDLWNRQRDTIANAIERGREAYQQARGAQPPEAPEAPAGEGL